MLYLMCDDLTSTLADLKSRGVSASGTGMRHGATSPRSSFPAAHRWAYRRRISGDCHSSKAIFESLLIQSVR